MDDKNEKFDELIGLDGDDGTTKDFVKDRYRDTCIERRVL